MRKKSTSFESTVTGYMEMPDVRFKGGRPTAGYVAAIVNNAEFFEGRMGATHRQLAEQDTQPIERIIVEESTIGAAGLSQNLAHYADEDDGPSVERVDFTQFK